MVRMAEGGVNARIAQSSHSLLSAQRVPYLREATVNCHPRWAEHCLGPFALPAASQRVLKEEQYMAVVQRVVWRSKLGRPAVAFLAMCLVAGLVVGTSRKASAAPISTHNVAYIYDDSLFVCGTNGCGMNDTSGPGAGASIFVNALTGTAPGTGSTGTYTTANGVPLTVSLVNVPLSALNTNTSALNGFDTAILYQPCTIGAAANAAAMTQINSFLSQGHKLLIFDADACASVAEGPADWSTFLFPFTTNSPGPQGASGSYVSVENSPLTAGLSVGPQPGDAVGDANVFTTFNGSWFRAITATNLNTNGIVEAYARSSGGGLAIYSGEDFWFTFGPSPHLRLVFDNMLTQPWDPDNLPGTNDASGITLFPSTQTVALGTTPGLIATVSDASGNPAVGVTVTLNVTSGPDQGETGSGVTDTSGQVLFTITNSGTAGTDNVQASFTDSAGAVHQSNLATVIFSQPNAFTYAALGDSFSSGEGNPPYQPGTNVDGVNVCHRSQTKAYPDLLANDVNATVFNFVACSGATTGNVTSASGNPGNGNDPEPLQTTALDASTNLVTITIGGNDIDFSDVLEFCVLFTCGAANRFSDVLKHLSKTISLLQPALVRTYTAIKQAAPNATVYVLGYPDLVPPHPSGAANLITCVTSGLVGGSLGWLAPKQRQLQDVIQNAASAAGVNWVDPNLKGAAYSFQGHTVCSSNSWFIRPINRHPTSSSFHPTSTGQIELEQALLANGAGSTNPNPGGHAATLQQSSDIALSISGSLSITQVGGPSAETFHIMGGGFGPGSNVGVGVADAGDVTTVTADQNGLVDSTVTIPAPSKNPHDGPGGIALTGNAANGDARVVFGPLS